MKPEKLVVPAALAGERIDRSIALITGRPRADIGRLIDDGGITMDGVAVTQRSRRLKEGDVLMIAVSELVPTTPTAVQPAAAGVVHFDVVYEDADVIVVNKPAGVVTHPGAGTREGTLVSGLLRKYPELALLPEQGCGSPERPGIVHRLDKDTSGLLVVGRSVGGFNSLTAQLAARTAKRTYLALVLGTLRAPEGRIDAPIGRSPKDPTKMAVSSQGREARTSYRVLRRFAQPLAVTELELRLDTGRTHQIRVHVAAIGHPVLGDRRYGGSRGSSGVRRLMLHATRLGFLAPQGGEELEFSAPPPVEYEDSMALFS